MACRRTQMELPVRVAHRAAVFIVSQNSRASSAAFLDLQVTSFCATDAPPQ
jgi:hypothetical protein